MGQFSFTPTEVEMFTISSLTGGDTEVQRISLICLCTQPEKGDARSQTVQPRACAPPYFILFVSVLAAPGLHCSAKAAHGLLLRGTWGLSSPSPAPAACWSCSVAQLCLTLCDLMDWSPPGSSLHGDSPGKDTGVGSRSLLQGDLPDPGIEPASLMSPALGNVFFTNSNTWEDP